MDRVLTIAFESSVTELCEVNSSFDSGVLKIAYTGENRNGSYISKEAFERAIPSIYNVPVVTHYNREDDTLGGHDMELVRDADGNLELINLTTPVGVIPESAKYWWDTVEEKDGTEHEYLFAEVLLWKRQEAYKKIKADGVVSHSMEITVKDGERRDGIYYINDFEFTAFALIGVEPCFENSELEVFSAQRFKAQMQEMMNDLRATFSQVTPPAGDDIHPQENQTEGGKTELEVNNEMVEEMTVETEEFETDATVEAAADQADTEETSVDAGVNGEEPEASAEETEAGEFELSQNIDDALRRALSVVKVHDEYGEWNRYWYVDYDQDKSEVYAEDCMDCRLYGMPYVMDGDVAVIDFESRSRKKWAIVDFEGEEDRDPLAPVFETISQQVSDCRSHEAELCALREEAESLRNYRERVEKEAKDRAVAELISQFSDLEGNDAFEKIKNKADEMDISTLEEKCFAIRGRVNAPQKFANDNRVPKIKVDSTGEEAMSNEPYGGLFAKYGNK